MKLKVCGITDLNQAQSLATMGVDYLGFIGYKKSPRYVWGKIHPEQLSSLNTIQKVGVFVNEEVDVILKIANEAKLDLIQLHGNEPLEDAQSIVKEYKVIKAIATGNDIMKVQEMVDLYQNDVDYLLFDTATKVYGGSGKQFNWSLLNDVIFDKPYFLSGGLSVDTPIDFENLNNKPIALDINSQFEIEPGKKDLARVQAFKQKVNTNKLKDNKR